MKSCSEKVTAVFSLLPNDPFMGAQGTSGAVHYWVITGAEEEGQDWEESLSPQKPPWEEYLQGVNHGVDPKEGQKPQRGVWSNPVGGVESDMA